MDCSVTAAILLGHQIERRRARGVREESYTLKSMVAG